MKRIAFLLCIICLCSIIKAEENAIDDKKYALATADNSIGYTSLRLFDSYLSPLEYKGWGIKMEFSKRRFFNPYNTNLSNQNKFELLVGSTNNPAKNASITYLGLSYSWGMHYHFRPIDKLQLLAGGAADISLGAKMHSRNVNNPFNMDLALNLNMSGVAIYDIHPRIRLQADFLMPAIGCMFVPGYGESYYEIFNLGNSSDIIHFSSFHNKIGFRQSYKAFFTLNRSVLSIGYTHNYLKYEANNLVFKKIESVFSIGWSYDIYVFAGHKHRAPNNFVKY